MAVEHFEGTAIINGVPIWHKVLGSGPALVVQSPGWGIGSRLYQETLSDLAAHFTLVFYDTRGSGHSDSADLDYAQVTVGNLVEDLEALRRHLALDRFALAGHSHGGYIALNYALKYPARLTALVLAGAQVGVEEPGEDLKRTLPRLAQRPEYREAVAAFTAPRALRDHRDFSAFLKKIGPLYFRHPAGPAFRRFIENIEHAHISLNSFLATASTDKRFTVRERLSAISTPTLCMVGEHDFICSPVQAQIIADAIPGAELRVFSESGHFCWMEEPEQFREVLVAFFHRRT
ncbi:proline-specific peptidase [Duganella sp. 1224]|uniref:alpha/beta fold hydrolase n=1 Tax=Duganella sp. 1224 TaxID=2587052 RepID=UPI0015CD59E8|nr:proline-specific peptidase [Duganella sp. 1224]